jgi:predicted HAD superfamily Cof-like phosphohydrolase
MQDKINAVKAFHTAFKIGHRETPKADLGIDKNVLRYKLMREENEEYLEAANDNDLVEVADALGDMLYILCGTIIEHGMQHKIEEVFEEIEYEAPEKILSKLKTLEKEIIDAKVSPVKAAEKIIKEFRSTI